MKLKEGFLIEHIDGRSIGVTCGDAATTFSGMVTSNHAAEIALNVLATGDASTADIVDAIAREHPDVDRDRIAADVVAWLDTLREHGLIDE